MNLTNKSIFAIYIKKNAGVLNKVYKIAASYKKNINF